MPVFWGALVVAASLLAVGSARAAEETDIAEAIATIRAFVGAETREAWSAHCTAETILVDHMPPYVFRGATACADYWDATVAWAAQNGIEVRNWGSITEPDFVDAGANQVYAVFPARVDWTRNGVPEIERGVWTFVVRRVDGIWRIAAHSFSTLEIVPIAAPSTPSP